MALSCSHCLYFIVKDKRGEQLDLAMIGSNRVLLKYKLPLSEVITDFFDRLKSLSQGYASFDYEECGYERTDIVKLSILLNGAPVDALSCILHRSRAEEKGRELVLRLKDVIPKFHSPHLHMRSTVIGLISPHQTSF